MGELVPQPTGIGFTLMYREMIFMAILTGPQLPQHSQALVANGLASPFIPLRGVKSGWEENIALHSHRVPVSWAHLSLSSAEC